jgi:hypothetical protein
MEEGRDIWGTYMLELVDLKVEERRRANSDKLQTSETA